MCVTEVAVVDEESLAAVRLNRERAFNERSIRSFQSPKYPLQADLYREF